MDYMIIYHNYINNHMSVMTTVIMWLYRQTTTNIWITVFLFFMWAEFNQTSMIHSFNIRFRKSYSPILGATSVTYSRISSFTDFMFCVLWTPCVVELLSKLRNDRRHNRHVWWSTRFNAMLKLIYWDRIKIGF